MLAEMSTKEQVTTTDKVKQVIEKGFSVTGIAKALNISRPTFYARMKDNSWSSEEIVKLYQERIIA
jgi:DNA invertase Pin-like site-specific DNA recombinase